MSKFFDALCASLGMKLVTTTEYDSHANGQVARYNHTFVARRHSYINDDQQDWDMLVRPLL